MRKLLAAMACAGLILAAGLTTTNAQTGKPKNGKKPEAKSAAKAKYVTTKSGLKYRDIKVGTGPSPKVTDYVTVNYVGKLTNGTVFDASAKHGGPIEFPLDHVIKGWTEGVSTMKVGGKRELICPPDLAYGANPPTPAIPPNSTLIFEVELVKIGQ